MRTEKLRQLLEQKHLQLSLFDEKNLAEIRSPTFPGERLIACFNPVLAEERKRKRKALLAATEPALARIAGEVGRRTKTPLSAVQIGQKVGRVINRHQVGNHFETHIGDCQFQFSRRQ